MSSCCESSDQPASTSKGALTVALAGNPNCGKTTRVKHGVGGDGRSTRVCSQCGENLTREAQKHD